MGANWWVVIFCFRLELWSKGKREDRPAMAINEIIFDNWRGQKQGEAIDKQWQKNEVIFINWLSYLYYAVGRPNPRFAIME